MNTDCVDTHGSVKVHFNIKEKKPPRAQRAQRIVNNSVISVVDYA